MKINSMLPLKKFAQRIFLSSIIAGGMLSQGLAQQASDSSVESTVGQGLKSNSGYENVPQFGGPSSATAELKEDDEVKETHFRFDWIKKNLEPWYKVKKSLNDQYGLSYSIHYSALYQGASESLGEDQAAGGIFQIPISWTVLGRGTANSGTIVFKVENRHRLGTDIVPQDFGFEAGALSITGTQFSKIDWALTNLFWQQKFNEGRLNFVVGQVDPTDYLDIYGLINPQTAFQNLSFLTNPTIASPNQGLGAAIGASITENAYLVAGFSDANGDPTDPGEGFDTFFDDNEYFKHIEIGWVSSFDRRYFDNIHITAWHVDDREKVQTPDGWGIAFSATHFIDDKWMPFVRAGYSDGDAALMEANVAVGIGRYFSGTRDLIGFGLSWESPPGEGLDDQYTAELFYRVQLSQNFAITPDIQFIIDPALNPTEDNIFVFGIRGRLTF
jgi:porin